MIEAGGISLARWLMLRLITVSLVMTAGIVLFSLAADGVPMRPFFLVVGVQYLVVGLGLVARRLQVPTNAIQASEILADLMVITACVHLTGGSTGHFTLLYFFPVLSSAYLMGRWGAMLAAIGGGSLYLTYSVATAVGKVQPTEVLFRGGAQSGTLLEGFLAATFLVVVGYLAGELSARVEEKATQLARKREQLAQAESETQGILDNMSSGVITLDPTGVIHRVNPAALRILQLAESDLVGRPVADVLGSKMPVLVGYLLDALTESRATERAEVNIERPDGSTLPLGISISQHVDQTGENQGVIAVFQNLTSVVKMRERIRANDRLAAMGELSASIAHEIRNPLASIRGSVEMLSGELDLDAENQRLMNLILKESARLNGMINDFLEYARLKPMHLTNRHLNELLVGLRELLESRGDVGKSLQVDVADAPLDLVVEVDEELMTQVFLNLALNAFDAMNGHGCLRIHTNVNLEERAPQVAVRFLDEGSGIEEEALERIFEPFFTTKSQGTGLGLPLANRIVSNHSGRIEVTNLDGGGAEFKVVLPLAGVWRDGQLDRNPGVVREFSTGAA